MLETPLYGKFANEDRILVFSAPTAYHALIRACVVGGALAALAGLLASFGVMEVPVGDSWMFFTGLAVCLAGVFAAWSLVLVRFDLKAGAYRRRDGGGAFGRTVQGSLADLDALVMIAEPNARLVAGGVTYHLVLHWKGGSQPPMVVQNDTRALPPGAPLDSGATHLRNRGMHYAKSLKVPFYDNAHFPSPNPVKLVR